eukprot:COSAG06_NODE_2997_length_5980_cov_65.382928_3_plen_286_part_00
MGESRQAPERVSAAPRRVAGTTGRAAERQRIVLLRRRCHWPRCWKRASSSSPRRRRLPCEAGPHSTWTSHLLTRIPPAASRVLASTGASAQRPARCRYHWPRHCKRAERPHLSGCQSCPGKHRSVSAAPCRVAGTTGHVDGRELNVLIEHSSGCQSCPGKHRSVSAAPRLAAGTTGRAAGRELNVHYAPCQNPSLLPPCPRTGGSRVGLARASEAGPATAGEPKSVLPKCSRTFGDVESSYRVSVTWYKGRRCRPSHCILRPTVSVVPRPLFAATTCGRRSILGV